MFRKSNIYVNIAPLFHLRLECSNLLSIPSHYYSKKLFRNLTISEITSNNSAVYLKTQNFQDNGIELIKNSPEDIKQLCIEAAKRHVNEWTDDEGDKLHQRFIKVFSNKKIFNSKLIMEKLKEELVVIF